MCVKKLDEIELWVKVQLLEEWLYKKNHVTHIYIHDSINIQYLIVKKIYKRVVSELWVKKQLWEEGLCKIVFMLLIFIYMIILIFVCDGKRKKMTTF